MKYCFNISRNITSMNNSLQQSKKLFVGLQKPIITLTIISLLLILIYQIYIRVIGPKIKSAEYQLVTNAKTTSMTLVPTADLDYLVKDEDEDKNESLTGQSIPDPYDQYSYTILLDMRIDDYVENLGYWKHILHKGTEDNSGSTWNFTTWDQVSANVPAQNPGLWLHPATNTIRFCINTTVKYNYLMIPEHADGETYFGEDRIISSVSRRELEKQTSKQEYDSPKTQLEYIDIPNIPINRDVKLTIIVDRTDITVLKNGKNYLFKQLQGLPKINPGPISIHHQTTYNGTLKELSILPFPLTKKNKKSFL